MVNCLGSIKPFNVASLEVWQLYSLAVWKSGSLAVVVSGIDGIERSSGAVVVVLKGTVYQKKLSHADAQGVGGLLLYHYDYYYYYYYYYYYCH